LLETVEMYPLVSGLRVFKPNISTIPSLPVFEIRPHLAFCGATLKAWLTVEG